MSKPNPPQAVSLAADAPAVNTWPPGLNTLLAGLALVAITLVAYLPLLHAGFIWDDAGWVFQNPLLTSVHGLREIWMDPDKSLQYYPLVFTAFWLEHHFWGFNPLGYHVVNILLQAADALILWRILRRLAVPGAWLVAALFAIHPVQVETVAWVTEQKNLLSAGFLFLAAAGWLRYAGVDDSASPPGKFRWYLLASFAFLLALFSKTDACTLPAVLWIITWWKRGTVRRFQGLSLIPWFILGLGLAMVTIHTEHAMVYAKGPRYTFTPLQHLVIAARDLWFYPAKLLWPHPLIEIYPRWNLTHISIVDYLAIAGAFAVPITLLALSKRIGRGPFCAVAFYGLTISPVLGFISFYTETYTFVADHYQYVPCIGLLALFVGVAAHSLRKFQAAAGTISPAAQNRAAGILAGCVVAAVIPATMAQSEVYLPSLHLWTHDLKYNPRSFGALDYVALHELNRGHPHKALILFHRAWLLSDKYDPTINADLGDLYNFRFHEPALAMPYYRRSLKSDPRQPELIIILVRWYEANKQWQRAYNDLLRGLELVPHSAHLRYELGEFDLMTGHIREGAGQLTEVADLEPKNTKANYQLALTLVELHLPQKAVKYFQRVIHVSPQFVPGHVSYARCLYLLGHYRMALAQLRTAETLAPASAVIHRAVAQVLKKMGHAKQAAAELKRADAEAIKPAPATTPAPAMAPAERVESRK